MVKAGYNKTAEQCMEDIEKLKLKYKKSTDAQQTSGAGRQEWPYFDDMDAVLDTRHAIEPPINIDTTVECLDNTPDEPEDDGKEETKDQLLGKSPLKKMATLKERTREEMFNAAIEKVTTAHQASDEKFLAIEEKRLKMEEKIMGQLQSTLAL